MRIGILMILPLFLLVLFAIIAISVDWDNPDSQSVDQMLAGPDQGAVIPPSGPVETPQFSRATQVGQTGKDILNVPLGNNPSSGASTPQETRSQELNQPAMTQPIVTTNGGVSVQNNTNMTNATKNITMPQNMTNETSNVTSVILNLTNVTMKPKNITNKTINVIKNTTNEGKQIEYDVRQQVEDIKRDTENMTNTKDNVNEIKSALKDPSY